MSMSNGRPRTTSDSLLKALHAVSSLDLGLVGNPDWAATRHPLPGIDLSSPCTSQMMVAKIPQALHESSLIVDVQVVARAPNS